MSRPEIVGGGLQRNQAGSLQHSVISVDEQMASDERILGDGNFVASVLEEAEDHMTTRQRYQLASFELEQLITLVAKLLEINHTQFKAPGKQPDGVRTRSLYCYWAVRELGYLTTGLSQELSISQPTVSQSVRRGEALAVERGWELSEQKKLLLYGRLTLSTQLLAIYVKKKLNRRTDVFTRTRLRERHWLYNIVNNIE